jgi:spore germination protein KA/spore germination protein
MVFEKLWLKKNRPEQSPKRDATYHFVKDLDTMPIFPTIQDNKQYLKQLFADCSDAVVREFSIGEKVSALLVFIDGMVNTELVNQAMRAMMQSPMDAYSHEHLADTMLPVCQLQPADRYGAFIQSVLGGDTGLIVDGQTNAMLLGIRGGNQRSISEPETETVVRGPREGFTENLRTNTSLLRRKIRTPKLKMKPLTAGRESNTNIVLCYMDDIVDPSLVDEVEQRVKKIDIDAVLESGYVEELIQDSTISPFPQIQYTERPDSVAAALLQGRIAILVDGTPMILLVPFVFWEFLQANEDYYERFHIATLIRWLRFIFLVLSLTTPAFYVAIISFHQDLLPTSLMLSIAAAREAIPFPAIVEALIMEVTFEALREAGIRLPKAVGSAVSILGALVVGQAAVQAGIVSAPVVIVVSITGIASFTIPRYNGAIAVRMLRFPIMIAASIFGIFGILGSLLLIVGHLANLRSFGTPYLSPVGPLSVQDLKDIFVRAPWPYLGDRPAYMSVQDTKRMGEEFSDELIKHEGQKGIRIKHEHSQPKEENS